MASLLRRFVSGPKRRFQEAGFDLDLSYITDRVMAMSWPGSGSEGLYRNPATEAARFIRTYHPESCRVYNLVSERPAYPAELLDCPVVHFPMEDHQPPSLQTLEDLCVDATTWLLEQPKNVVIFHCKAGKGRTGTAVSCLLLYLGVHHPELFPELQAVEVSPVQYVLDLFASRRTVDHRGISVPSQRRYVEYFYEVLTKGYPPACEVVITEIRIRNLPPSLQAGCQLGMYVRHEAEVEPQLHLLTQAPTSRVSSSLGSRVGVHSLSFRPASARTKRSRSIRLPAHDDGVTRMSSMASHRSSSASWRTLSEGASVRSDSSMRSARSLSRSALAMFDLGVNGAGELAMDDGNPAAMQGDIKLQVLKGNQSLFCTWLSSSFLPQSGLYTLTAEELDRPSRWLPKDVEVDVIFEQYHPAHAAPPAPPSALPLQVTRDMEVETLLAIHDMADKQEASPPMRSNSSSSQAGHARPPTVLRSSPPPSPQKPYQSGNVRTSPPATPYRPYDEESTPATLRAPSPRRQYTEPTPPQTLPTPSPRKPQAEAMGSRGSPPASPHKPPLPPSSPTKQPQASGSFRGSPPHSTPKHTPESNAMPPPSPTKPRAQESDSLQGPPPRSPPKHTPESGAARGMPPPPRPQQPSGVAAAAAARAQSLSPASPFSTAAHAAQLPDGAPPPGTRSHAHGTDNTPAVAARAQSPPRASPFSTAAQAAQVPDGAPPPGTWRHAHGTDKTPAAQPAPAPLLQDLPINARLASSKSLRLVDSGTSPLPPVEISSRSFTGADLDLNRPTDAARPLVRQSSGRRMRVFPLNGEGEVAAEQLQLPAHSGTDNSAPHGAHLMNTMAAALTDLSKGLPRLGSRRAVRA